MGLLARQVCAPNFVRAEVARTHPGTGDLEKKGFTRYVNLGGGKFEKAGAGSGPDTLDVGKN